MTLFWANCVIVLLCFSIYRMFGLFQTVFYFSYMALGSIALGLLCGTYILILHVHHSLNYVINSFPFPGTVGYIGTSFFVRKIYATVKID